MDQVDRFCRETESFVIGAGGARPFERLQWMRTTEQLFIVLALELENVKKALGIIHEFYLIGVRWIGSTYCRMALWKELMLQPICWLILFYREGGLVIQCEFGPAAGPENIERYFDKLQ